MTTPAFDAAAEINNNDTTSGGVSKTLSTLTIAPNGNRILVVWLMFEYTCDNLFSGSSVTWNGVALTHHRTYSPNLTNAKQRIELWYLKNPAAGNYDIVATRSGNGSGSRFCICASSYYDVDQTNPFGTAVDAVQDSTNTAVSATVTGLATDMFISGAMGNVVSGNITNDTANGEVSDALGSGTNMSYGSARMPGQASVAMGWHSTNARWWAMTAIPLQYGSGSRTGSDSIALSLYEQSQRTFAPPDEPQTYTNPTGDTYACVMGIMVKATVNKITSAEVLRQIIAGGDACGPLADQLTRKTSGIVDSDPDYPELRSLRFENTTAQEAVSILGPLSDVAQKHMWFGAVWEGRRFHFGPMHSTHVRWRIYKSDLGEGGLKLERAMSNYWSAVQSYYKNSNDVWRSVAPRSDPKYRDNTPVTRRYTMDMGNNPVTTIARDAFYEDFRVPQPNTEIQMTGHVHNAYGAQEPLWRVRAGDVFRVVDLFSDHFVNAPNTVDPLRTFIIKETTYDMATNTLTITPAVMSDRLDTLVGAVQQIMG